MGLTKLLCFGILPLFATAQDTPIEVKYNLRGLTYPRVGRLARVQGVVKLELMPGETGQEINVISGHGMLVQTAKDNLAKWRTDQPVTVNYIFRLTDAEIVKVRVPKGDAFGRLFLRMLHLTTYTEQTQCRMSVSDPSNVSEPRLVQESPFVVDVEITVPEPCLMTATSLVAHGSLQQIWVYPDVRPGGLMKSTISSDIHTVSRKASKIQAAQFLVFFVKDKGAPETAPVK